MTPARHRHLATFRACSALPPAISEYFVVMIDHGRRGLEAIVDPEITRREVIRRILTLEYDPAAIRFVHHVTSAGVENVTFDIMADCAREALGDTPDPIDRRAAAADRAHDLRKNWEA